MTVKNNKQIELTDDEIALAVGSPLDEVYPEDFRKVLAAQAAKREAQEKAKSELERDAPDLLFALIEAAGYLRSHCTIETLKRKVSLLIRKHGDFAKFHQDELAAFNLKETAYDSLQEAASRSNWIPAQYCADDWLADCRRWLEFGPDLAENAEQRTEPHTDSSGDGGSTTLAAFPWIAPQAQEDLLRFCETCADNEGYDVPKERMNDLAKLGLVRRVAGRIFEITQFGRHVEGLLEGSRLTVEPPSFPVSLRKMWSGSEVQEWLNENVRRPALYIFVSPQEPTEAQAESMGAQGAMATEAERLRFEAWMRGHCWSLGATWNGKEYRGENETKQAFCPSAIGTRMLWAAWRDRGELARRSVLQAREQIENVLRIKAA